MPHSVRLGHNAVKYFLCVIITLVNVFVHIKYDLSHSGISGYKPYSYHHLGGGSTVADMTMQNVVLSL